MLSLHIAVRQYVWDTVLHTRSVCYSLRYKSLLRSASSHICLKHRGRGKRTKCVCVGG